MPESNVRLKGKVQDVKLRFFFSSRLVFNRLKWINARQAPNGNEIGIVNLILFKNIIGIFDV